MERGAWLPCLPFPGRLALLDLGPTPEPEDDFQSQPRPVLWLDGGRARPGLGALCTPGLSITSSSPFSLEKVHSTSVKLYGDSALNSSQALYKHQDQYLSPRYTPHLHLQVPAGLSHSQGPQRRRRHSPRASWGIRTCSGGLLSVRKKTPSDFLPACL